MLEKLRQGFLVSYPGQEKKARWGVRLVSSDLKLKGKPSVGDVGWTMTSMSGAHPGGNNLWLK